MPYPLNASPTLHFEFELDDVPTDPTDIDLTITSPSGAVTAIDDSAMTNVADGIWEYDGFVFDEAGSWTISIEATGAVVYANSWKLWIKPR